MGLYKAPDNSIHDDMDGTAIGIILQRHPGAAPITAEEAAAILAPSPEEAAAIAAAAAQTAQDHADALELKADVKFQALISKTPQQCTNWAKSNFPTLTLPEQRDLGTLVQCIGILGRRL